MHLPRRVLILVFFFGFLSALGQNPVRLTSQLDSVIRQAIDRQAFPGCVVYASVGDSTIFLRSYGYHTYDSVRKVAVNDLYDLASITKVVGGTLALMKMYDQGYFKLEDPIGMHVKGLGRKVGAVTIREALAHHGGLHPWIPFYQEVRRKNGKFKRNTISTRERDSFDFALADSLYLHHGFYRKIKRMIRRSEVSEKIEYRYSGLFFYLVPEMVENLTGMSYENYLRKNFYDRLGAHTLTYNPLTFIDISQVVPTEIDTFFRMRKIHGLVHDEGAILMKGVSSNAGLFSNAGDLAKIFQMFLNNGKFDNTVFLTPQTINLFTTSQYVNECNRRALGFDKPLLLYSAAKSSVAKSASHLSYGHTGYTGTLAWADPKNDLIFIFLTNRVYPNRTSKAIYELNVRPTLHQIFYEYLNTD